MTQPGFPADNASSWSVPLVTIPANAGLALPASVGQRAATFRFDVVDALTGATLGQVHPLMTGAAPVLRHDTTRTVSRDLTLEFGRDDTAFIDPVRHRITVSLVPAGASTVYPLGRYMFVDHTRIRSTTGTHASSALVDEMFIVDQPAEESFAPTATAGYGLQHAVPVPLAVARLLDGLPLRYDVEPSGYETASTWPAGTSRAKILTDLAVEGGYFAPWFDHHGVLRLVRAFDPADRVPDVDLDVEPRVWRDSFADVTDLLEAPNRFVVVGNTGTEQVVVGHYDVPASAPHSIIARGFAVTRVQERQVGTADQATAAARAIGLAATIVERTELSTSPDPRHDAYTVIRWAGQVWLEVSWSMQLREGGAMRHVMRKAYR